MGGSIVTQNTIAEGKYLAAFIILWTKIPYVTLRSTKQLHTLKLIFLPLRLLTIFRQLFDLFLVHSTQHSFG